MTFDHAPLDNYYIYLLLRNNVLLFFYAYIVFPLEEMFFPQILSSDGCCWPKKIIFQDALPFGRFFHLIKYSLITCDCNLFSWVVTIPSYSVVDHWLSFKKPTSPITLKILNVSIHRTLWKFNSNTPNFSMHYFSSFLQSLW